MLTQAQIHTKKILTVSEVTRDLKELVQDNFPSLWLKGEISNFKAYHSGHYYFTLKDPKAQISAVMFKGYNRQLKFKPEDGMAVICHGNISVYEARGNYQLIVNQIEPDGLGALQMAFDQLKQKLQNEGLFADERKRQIPKLPQTVGIITSGHGAAVHDMINVLQRRYPNINILIYPVKVQGDGAAQEIVQALQYFSSHKNCDCLIVGRGGGSLEDLWAFNEESVARAVADCPLPVISAVGHETDFSICDFVADLRAPTPSAAAELCVPLKLELENRINQQSQRLHQIIQRHILKWRTQMTYQLKSIPTPRTILDRLYLRLDDLEDRLYQILNLRIRDQNMRLTEYKLKILDPQPYLLGLKDKINGLKKDLLTNYQTRHVQLKHELQKYDLQLKLLNPQNVLKRGFVMAKALDGKVITRKKQAKPQQEIELVFYDGAVRSKVIKT